MACNALYKFFAIIEIVLQLFTDCPFCCQCLCALSTFCSLLFALFVVFRAQLAHHLRKSVRHLSATATFGFDLFAAFSCCSPSGSYCCSYSCCCCSSSSLAFFFGAKQIVSRQKQSHTAFAAEAQSLLCLYVCVCVCALGATFNSARCVGAARREKILHPQPTTRTTNCC